jgi:hypothetical protein
MSSVNLNQRPDRVAILFLLAVLALAGLEVWAIVSLF